MKHYHPGSPKVGLPIAGVGAFALWLGVYMLYAWDGFAVALIVLGFLGLMIGLGISAPSEWETDRRGRVLPPRRSDGRFKRWDE
jgi:hypothetical protein